MRVRTKLIGALALLAPMITFGLARPATAVPLTVRVTLERIRALDDFGGFGTPEDADFYGVVNIDGQEFDNKNTPDQDAKENQDDISPNWEFSRQIDSSRAKIPISIDIYDEDGFLRGDDDHADITPGPGRGLGFDLTLVPCGLTGGITGSCNTSLVTAGTADDRAELTFKVEVVEPASAPGLRVRCLHSPLAPKPGQPVTITAESLDGSVAPRLADDLGIWVQDVNAPAKLVHGATTTSYTFTAPAGDSFTYGCRVRDDALTAFTGWRRVGLTWPAGQPRPILINGPTSSRVDIVFTADGSSYQSPQNPAFDTDAANLILNGYYSKAPSNTVDAIDTHAASTQDFFLRNHDKFNFWIAPTTGQSQDSDGDCSPEADEIPFADAQALLHSAGFRDCALPSQHLFTSEPTSAATVLHETGHAAFGLADEYCCDGGYFQSDTDPNVYEEPEDCTADAPSLGRTASACREFDEVVDWWFDPDWSVSEPTVDDLMNDRGQPQAADTRRMNALFTACQSAGC